MVTELERLVAEELPGLRDHFDYQLSAIRVLVETNNAKQEVNQATVLTQINTVVRDIAEVKVDVKAQNGKVGVLEKEMAFQKGKDSGSRTTSSIMLATLGVISGIGATLATVIMVGR